MHQRGSQMRSWECDINGPREYLDPFKCAEESEFVVVQRVLTVFQVVDDPWDRLLSCGAHCTLCGETERKTKGLEVFWSLKHAEETFLQLIISASAQIKKKKIWNTLFQSSVLTEWIPTDKYCWAVQTISHLFLITTRSLQLRHHFWDWSQFIY